MSLSPSHFSRFTSLKMFHVKHRFLRFSVFGNQWEAICFPAFRKSLSFFASLIFKTIVFSILFLIFPSFLHFSCIFACFKQFFISAFSLLLNYLIIFLYFRMNWTFTFVFSDFPNHLLNAFWGHFFGDFCQSGRILSHSAVFMLLCVLLHHFFSVFCSYVNHLNMPFASSWHNVVLLELSTLFAELRLIFVSFSHFSLNFCIVSFPFFAYNKLNTTFRTNFSPWGAPERSFIILWNTAKNWSL